MPIENYVLGDVIGKGSYGEVTLARHRKDKKQYVIKKIDFHNASEKERLYAQQEVDILSKLRHPNIVSYKESFQTEDGGLSIVMGYCELGDLYQHLKKHSKRGEFLEETKIVEWFVQITMALQYMHDRHILHRDLKTQNIFLTKSKIIKLGDLGIARVLESNCDMATTMIGTPYYMSPELFSNKPYNHKSDVWALGCCLYEMCTLKHAFNARDMNSLVYKILKGKTPDMPSNYSHDLLEIIKSMLNYDPELRPSASRLLRLPYIKKQIAVFLEGTKNRRHLREERKSKSVSKAINLSHDSGFSDAANEDSQQGIATASKIEVQLPSEEEKPIIRKELKENIRHSSSNDNRNIDRVVRRSRSGPLNDDNERKKSTTEEKKVESKYSKSDNSNHRSKDRSEQQKAVNIRKILSDRIQAKARSRRRELEEEQNVQVKSPPKSPPIPDKYSNGNNKPSQCKEKTSASLDIENKPRRQLPALSSVDNGKNSVLPQFRHGNVAKKEIKLKEISQEEEPPKSCAPNMAARKKRRLRQQTSDSVINLSPKHSDKKIVENQILSSHQARTKEEIIKDHLSRASIDQSEKSEIDEIDGPNTKKSLSPEESDNDDDNDDEDTIVASQGSEKNSYDVSSLIDTLQATLKMGSKSKDLDGSQDFDEKTSSFSPSATGRLRNRIKLLRKECIDGIGETLLQRAYDIINTQPEDDVERSLVNLLGKENFEEYAGQIWQLKFCEEF